MLYIHVKRTAASTVIVSSWNILPSLVAFAPACYRCCIPKLYYPQQWDIAARWRVVGMWRVLRNRTTCCTLTLTMESWGSRNALYPVRFCCHYACTLPNQDLGLRMSMMCHLVSTVPLYSNIYYPIVSVARSCWHDLWCGQALGSVTQWSLYRTIPVAVPWACDNIVVSYGMTIGQRQ